MSQYDSEKEVRIHALVQHETDNEIVEKEAINAAAEENTVESNNQKTKYRVKDWMQLTIIYS